MKPDVSAIREACGDGDENVWWTFEPTPNEDGWLITREEGTYTQTLEASPGDAIASIRAMICAAEALNDAMRSGT